MKVTCSFTALLLLNFTSSAMGFSLSAGGVWDATAAGGATRILWNPSTGNVGNMGDGVLFDVGLPPAAAQAGAAAAANRAFEVWNSLGSLPTVRINLAPGGGNIPLEWGVFARVAITRGNNAPDGGPRPITLSNTRVLRTDGWNLDFTNIGVRDRPAIDEYDVFTVAVHEVGHAIGLGHPTVLKIATMTQGRKRTEEGGSWRAIEQTTPFDGQPTKLDGGALPIGAFVYQNNLLPDLTADDILGAVTLYSPPIASIIGFVEEIVPGLLFKYEYKVDNFAAVPSGYRTREVRIPVPSDVNITNLQAPSEWNIFQEGENVIVEFADPNGGLIPDEQLEFSFDADAPPTSDTPIARWLVDGLEAGNTSSSGDGFGDESDDMGTTPDFNFRDFGVLDEGRFTYELDNSGRWNTVEFDQVPIPRARDGMEIPEPTSILSLLALGIASTLKHKMKSSKSSENENIKVVVYT